MKEELYQYSIALQKRSESIPNRTVGLCCIVILVMMFSVFIALLNVWLMLAIILPYIALFIYNRTRKDEYEKLLFDLGLFIFYLALELSVIIYTDPASRLPFFIFLLIGLTSYEIKFYSDLKHQKYSLKNKNFNTQRALIMGSITTICGCIGLRIGRAIGKKYANTDSDAIIIMGAIIVALLFTAAVSYLQKYAIYRYFQSKNSSAE